MNIIKWQRESVKNISVKEALLKLDKAAMFRFNFLNTDATLLLPARFNWKKGIVGFATTGENKWVLKFEREDFLTKIKFFNLDTWEYVTRFRGDELFLKTGHYWIVIKKKYLLNYNRGKKIRFTVFNNQEEIFNAWANYNKESLFNNIYDSNINGEIEFAGEPDWELIFSAFISFYMSIKSEQENSA